MLFICKFTQTDLVTRANLRWWGRGCEEKKKKKKKKQEV
jgi:hypothetical protein